MSTNQERFNDAYTAVIAQLDGSSPTDVLTLDERLSDLSEACNPLAYDPSNPRGTFTPAQYAKLFNFGFTALMDSDGEIFYFDDNPDVDDLKAQNAYVVAKPRAKSADRSQDANQAVLTEMLNLLVRSAGSASDELATYALDVIEDALSLYNRCPAVLTDSYRSVLADILVAFKNDGAGEVVLDRLESLLTARSHTALIVDSNGVARPDKGLWS